MLTQEVPTLEHRKQGGRLKLPRLQEAGLLVVFVFLFMVLSYFGHIYASGRNANNFLTWDNLVNGVAQSAAIYAIMAVGMTCVVITGGIDISVGAMFGLCAFMSAYILQFLVRVEAPSGQEPFVSWAAPAYVAIPAAVLVPMVIGLLCGAFNGLLITVLRLHPFIVTLSTMSIFTWAARVWNIHTEAGGKLPRPPNRLPPAFTEMMNIGGGIALMPFIVMLLTVLAGWVFLSWTVAGRETYAVGGNEEAARYSGLRVAWVKMRAYVIMGLTCGIAAMVTLGRFEGGSTTTGQGDELKVIAAAVVVGASLSGGRGTALGAFMGAVVMQLITNGITILKLNRDHEAVVIGFAILAAASIDRLSEYLRQRRLARGV